MRALARIVRVGAAVIATILVSSCGLIIGLEDHEPFPDDEEKDAGAHHDAGHDASEEEAGCATQCGGVCVDTKTDPANCGFCGIACAAGYGCTDGICDNRVAKVAAGTAFQCALLRDGSVHCWGGNGAGALGHAIDGPGDTLCTASVCNPTPTKVSGLPKIADLSLGAHTACALDTVGAVWCWGANGSGQLGHMGGDDLPSCNPVGPCNPTPSKVASLPAITQVSVGAAHVCARTQAGALYCWGANQLGQLGIGQMGVPLPTPVAVGVLSSGVAEVSASIAGDYTCARKDDGTAWCWGQNIRGALGHATANDAVCVNGQRCSAVPSIVQLASVTRIRTGRLTTCAETTSGPFCWGNNGWGELGGGAFDTGEHASPAPVSVLPAGVTIDLRYEVVCGIDGAGQVSCIGENSVGAVGTGALDGTPGEAGVLYWPTPRPLAVLGPVKQLSLGAENGVALMADGSVWSWGHNTDARLAHLPGMNGDIPNCSGVGTCNPVPKAMTGLP